MPDGTKDPASLENLHDIIAPGPAPWWPPAPGWYVLGLLLLVVATLLVIRVVLRWRNNRYRREALARLTRLQQSSQDADRRPDAVAQLGELLKRVALAAWPRETVANLSGRRWLEFLQATGGGKAFPEDASLVLCDVAYCRKLSDELSAAQVEEIFAAAGDWIATHDASVSGPSVPKESNR
jgi:hypothetical protein